MKKTLCGTTLLLCLMVFGGVPVARAAPITIFSNLGPGDTHGTNLTGTDNSSFPNYLVARGFSAVNSAKLDSVDIGVFDQPSLGNSFVIQLRSDAAGLPGAILESWSTSAPEVSGSVSPTNPPLLSLSSVIHPSLSAATNYWLAAGSATSGGWWTAPPGSPNQLFSVSLDGGATFFTLDPNNSAAFRLTGTDATNGTVPEPSTLLFLMSGLGGLIALRWRRRPRAT
ncbi:MAG: PEP-CTERM sorting domain-containing protein [Nitrospirota bacterium]